MEEEKKVDEPDIGGRPPIFKTPEEMEKAVDEYISITPVKDRTMTGLCMWLGFVSRQSLHDYKKREGFSYPALKALMAIENSYEVTLRSANAPGSIFALKNMGWKDKTETELSGAGAAIQIIMPPDEGEKT
jgi:hypothetical protein